MVILLLGGHNQGSQGGRGAQGGSLGGRGAQGGRGRGENWGRAGRNGNWNQQQTQTPQVRPTSTLAQPPLTKSQWECRYCSGKSFHIINQSATFLAADVTYRMNMLRSGGYCFSVSRAFHVDTKPKTATMSRSNAISVANPAAPWHLTAAAALLP